MPLARFIVCETTSKWAIALRRRLPAASDPRLYEMRSLDDCWQQAAAHPASFVALEATVTNLEQVVDFLRQCRGKLPRVRVVVLGDRQLTDAEWFLREAGAIHVVFSSRAMEPLIRMIRRHWRAAATADATAREPGWSQLPWGDNWVRQASPRPAWLCEKRESTAPGPGRPAAARHPSRD